MQNIKSLGNAPLSNADFKFKTEAWSRISFLGGLGTAFDTDASGNIYIGGTFQESISFEHIKITSSPRNSANRDLFLAKLDKDGNVVWAERLLNLQGAAIINDIHIDGNDLYLSGGFSGRFTTSGNTHSATDGKDGFIFKYKPSVRRFEWVKTYGDGTGDDQMLNIVQSGDDLFVGGSFTNSIRLGAATLQTNSDGGGFILKLNKSGDSYWSVQVFKPVPLGERRIIPFTVANNKIYYSGSFIAGSVRLLDKNGNLGRAGFNPMPQTDPNYSTSYTHRASSSSFILAIYSSQGIFEGTHHIRTIITTASTSQDGLALEVWNGSVYLLGHFTAPAIYLSDGRTKVVENKSSGTNSVFVFQYDLQGKIIDGLSFSSIGRDRAIYLSSESGALRMIMNSGGTLSIPKKDAMGIKSDGQTLSSGHFSASIGRVGNYTSTSSFQKKDGLNGVLYEMVRVTKNDRVIGIGRNYLSKI